MKSSSPRMWIGISVLSFLIGAGAAWRITRAQLSQEGSRAQAFRPMNHEARPPAWIRCSVQMEGTNLVYSFNDARCVRTSLEQAVNQVAATGQDISSRLAVGEQVPIGEALSLMRLFWQAGLRDTRFLISNVEEEWGISGQEQVRELVCGPLCALDTYERIWAAQPDWVQSPEFHYSHDYDHLGWKPLVHEN